MKQYLNEIPHDQIFDKNLNLFLQIQLHLLILIRIRDMNPYISYLSCTKFQSETVLEIPHDQALDGETFRVRRVPQTLQAQKVLREAHVPRQTPQDGRRARLRLLRRDLPHARPARRPFRRRPPRREHHKQHKRVRRDGRRTFRGMRRRERRTVVGRWPNRAGNPRKLKVPRVRMFR